MDNTTGTCRKSSKFHRNIIKKTYLYELEHHTTEHCVNEKIKRTRLYHKAVCEETKKPFGITVDEDGWNKYRFIWAFKLIRIKHDGKAMIPRRGMALYSLMMNIPDALTVENAIFIYAIASCYYPEQEMSKVMPNKIIFALCASILLLPFASCRRGTDARSDEIPVFSYPALQDSIANFVRAVGEIDNPYEAKTITNVNIKMGEVYENVVDTLIEIEATFGPYLNCYSQIIGAGIVEGRICVIYNRGDLDGLDRLVNMSSLTVPLSEYDYSNHLPRPIETYEHPKVVRYSIRAYILKRPAPLRLFARTIGATEQGYRKDVPNDFRY